MPERIQLRRTKGWRKPEGAVVVSRPSRWGNPIRITPERGERDGQRMYRVHGSPTDVNGGPSYCVPETARHFAVKFFEWDLLNGRYGDAYPSLAEIRRELAGRDLACWCPLPTKPGQPDDCHARVLMDIADGAWANLQPDPAAPAVHPDPPVMAHEAYGVHLEVRESCTVVAAGHVPADRFLAAASRVAREVHGMPLDEAVMLRHHDQPAVPYATLAAGVEHVWAVRLPKCLCRRPGHDADHDPDPAAWRITVAPGGVPCTAGTPGARPYTVGEW